MSHTRLQLGLCLTGTAVLALLMALPQAVLGQQLPAESMSIVRLTVPPISELLAAQKQLHPQLQGDPASQAQRCTAQAEQETQSMAMRLVLRKQAALSHAQASEWREALRACDILTSEFNLPYAGMRGEVLVQIPINTDAPQLNKIAPERLLLLCLDTADGCLMEDDFSMAQSLVQRAEKLGGSLQGRPSAQQLQQRIDTLSPLYKDQAEHAKKRLLTNPLDKIAHEMLANYYGYKKGDWEAALPHFALASNPTLKALAIRDLALPTTATLQNELADAYAAEANRAQPEPAAFMRARSSYWRGVSKVRAAGLARLAGQGGIAGLTEGLSSRYAAPDSLAQRRVPPDGAALALSFHPDATVASSAPPIAAMINGRRSQGNRVVLYDGSPRGNNSEALFARSQTSGIVDSAWRTDGAPIIVPRRLFGALSGYTWTGWLQPDYNQSAPGFLFAETSAASFQPESQSPELSFDGRMFRFHGARHWYPEKILRSSYTLLTKPSSEWAFVAITVTPSQRLRVYWNDSSEEVPIAAGRSNRDGFAVLGAISGVIDDLSMYPRALSDAEVKSIYHYGLHGYPIVEYRPSKETLPPIFYRPQDLAGGPNVGPVPNNPGSTGFGGGGFGANSPGPTNTPPPPAVAKRPRPTDDEFKEAKKLVKDLYAKDIEKANTAEERRKIARKMQDVARETTDPPAARYALFFEAATMLTNFDSPDAWDAWGLLSNDFQGSFHGEKSDVLDRLLKRAKLPGEYKLLADRYVTLLNEALKEDDYKSADQLASRAETCVKKAGDKVLERMVAQGAKDLAQMKSAFAAAKLAKETLVATPDDAAANLQWGRYLAFYRNQWPDGLKLLVKAGEDPLAVLARKDAVGASATADQQELGDAWWTESEKLTDERAQRSIRGRAVHWYRQALPQLMGLTSAKIAKRVDAYLSETSPIPTNTPFDALSMIDTAVHSTSADWGRQGAVVGFTPRSGASYNRLMIPVGLHGNYEMQTKIEWLATFGGDVVMQLPVGERMVEVHYGRSAEMRLGDPSARAKIEQGGADFQRGKIYALGAKVSVEGDNATVLTTINGRPYLSWTGPLSQTGTIDMMRTTTSRTRAGNALAGALLQPVITIQGGYSESFAIGALQLEVQSGWAEPILR